MYITNIKNTKELKTPHNKSIRWLLPKEIGVPNFEMRYFEVKKESVPSEEKHPWEHEVFILSGKGVVVGEQGATPIGKESVVFITPNEPHCFVNTANEPLRFICVIPLQQE